MRRSVAASLLGLTLTATGCSAPPTPKTLDTHADWGSSEEPSWLTPYSPAQNELLRPTETALPVPSPRIFPNLSIFEYTRDERLDDLENALNLARLVLNTMHTSPRLYVLHEDMKPELANTVALYGPDAPDEPDPWERVRKNESGDATFVKPPPSDRSRAALALAYEQRESGDTKAAIETLKRDARIYSAAPLALTLADLLEQNGDDNAALHAYDLAARIEPGLPQIYLGKAHLHEKAGRRREALKDIAEALAYDPKSKRAQEMAERLRPRDIPSTSSLFPRFHIFLDVDAIGAIHVGYATKTDAARTYAGCRAIIRYERDLRSALFEIPRRIPYFLNLGEEIVCLEAAIGAYAAQRLDDHLAVEPKMEALIELARQDGLTGFAMFEILGKRRPERARAAPREVHALVLKYVERFILGSDLEGAEQSEYTAQR